MQLPQSYQDWYICLTVDCKISPTASFFRERLAAMQNEKDVYTQSFIQLYGYTYYQQVLAWFYQATLQVPA